MPFQKYVFSCHRQHIDRYTSPALIRFRLYTKRFENNVHATNTRACNICVLLLGDISVEFFFFYSHRGKSFRHKFCKYLTEIRSPKPAHILFLTNCQSISGFFISERAFQSCFSRLYLIITVIIVVNEREMQSEMLCSLCSYDSFCL